ncbi:DUF6263 family protein [Chitinophagaceae bacterium MMS25-I14]
MRKIVLIFLGAAFLLQGCKSADPVNLKFNLQPGDKFGYSTVTKQHMTAGAMSVNQDIRMDNVYEVSAAEGNNKKITAMFKRIVMEMAGNGTVIMYDSKDPSKQDWHLKFMGGLIDKPFNMVVSDKGTIITIKGLTDVVNNLSDSAGINNGIKNQVSQMFSDTAVRAILQQSFYLYPDNPVKPNDTWTKEMDITGIIGMKINTTFKFLSASNGVAHLEINSVIKGVPPADGPMKDIVMNGTQKGTMDVQTASGMVAGGKINQSIKGSVKDMNGKDMPIDVNTNIEITGQKL